MAETSTTEAQGVDIVLQGGKFLTFFLDTEEYGIEILRVREIIGLMAITRVPKTESYIRGIINLRGKVIPIIDLRAKFLMMSTESTDETCIIVVQAQGHQVGLLVDKVSEVVDIASDNIVEPPALGDNNATDYILGIGKGETSVTLLLDIDTVLSAAEAAEVAQVAETATALQGAAAEATAGAAA